MLSWILLLALQCSWVLAQYQQALGEFPTCSLLAFHLPERVSFPGSSRYELERQSYWGANQGELKASCYVAPQSSDDVQTLMFLLSRSHAAFAIKSGGHSVVANTSNVSGGITVDLQNLKHVTVKTDDKILDVGAGARWTDVYSELDRTKSNLTIAGARAGSVGVGGYILGGGLSIFSGDLGWSCDQVSFFEIVLANGTLLEVSRDSVPDLFKVLKGGGSNFGVVTRLGIRLVPRTQIEVVFVQYQWSELTTLLKAVTEYNTEALHNAGSVSVSIGNDGGPPGITAVLTHTHVSACALFDRFFAIPHTITRSVVCTQRDLAHMYDEMNQSGFRQHRSTTTIHNNAELLTILASNMTLLSAMIKSFQEPGARGGLLIQPLTLSHLRAGNAYGGNILGLEDETVPLLMLSLELRHTAASLDHRVAAYLTRTIADIDQVAVSSHLNHSFRYMNYASADQKVFQNIREREDSSLWSTILATKAKYDTDNVLGRLIHGPFRI